MQNFFDKFIHILQYNQAEPLLFNSGFFLYFFLIVLVFNNAWLHTKRARSLFLTVMSIYFYYKSSGLFFYLVIISSMIDFFAGHGIGGTNSKRKKKLFLVLSIITNLGILGYFKYTNFFFDTLNSMGANFDMVNIFLPVGVSFFTFQSMSYTIDIYFDNIKPENNFLDFLFFVSFFPQLVAGPIVRAKDFLPQIHQKPVISKADIGKAMFLIIAGLTKKAIIADYISINFVDRVFDAPTHYTGVENLLGLYGYVIQIYCDFSGYSDMAIGLALLMGFKLPMNFNAPYKAKTITEFWQRWHISLSTWLRDYLYIPLGGNRKGKRRTYINLMLTMVLGGLWHGASWRFVIWGAWHGAWLAVERFFGIPKKIKTQNPFVKFLAVILTLHIWAFSMIFFRAQSYEKAFEMISQIFNYFQPEVFVQFLSGYTTVFVMIVVGFILQYTPGKIENKFQETLTNMPMLGKALALAIMIFLVAQFKSADIQPFIYFQF